MTYQELAKKCKPKKMKETTVLTGVMRLSFPNLFTPVAKNDIASFGKYSVGFVVNEAEEETLQLISEAIEKAIEQGAEDKWKDKKVTLDTDRIKELEPEKQRDGDKFVIRTTAKEKPFKCVRDINNEPITEDNDKVYSGAYCRAILRAYPWGKNGNYGVSLSVDGIQILKGGDPYGDRVDLDEAFKDDEVADMEDF